MNDTNGILFTLVNKDTGSAVFSGSNVKPVLVKPESSNGPSFEYDGDILYTGTDSDQNTNSYSSISLGSDYLGGSGNYKISEIEVFQVLPKSD